MDPVRGRALFAAWLVPGIAIEGLVGRIRRRRADRDPERAPAPAPRRLRLPLTLVLGFLLVLVLDAAMFIARVRHRARRDLRRLLGRCPLAALVASAASVILDPIFRTNDDETYMLRVTQRIARRSGEQVHSDEPGIVFLEIDGLALPVLQRAMRDGSAPGWRAGSPTAATRWPSGRRTSPRRPAPARPGSCSARTRTSAFRWVEKESGRTMTCSKPEDCEEIERRVSTGVGLLRDGGASRGNLLSGGADHVILTVSRIAAEKKANPGYRAFFANGFNVTRLLVLFGWESCSSGPPRSEQAPRRPPARAPRWALSVHAGRHVRDRPRPDRLRRDQRRCADGP